MALRVWSSLKFLELLINWVWIVSELIKLLGLFTNLVVELIEVFWRLIPLGSSAIIADEVMVTWIASNVKKYLWAFILFPSKLFDIKTCDSMHLPDYYVFWGGRSYKLVNAKVLLIFISLQFQSPFQLNPKIICNLLKYTWTYTTKEQSKTIH